MIGVSASVNLPLHHKVQKLSSGTGSPGWSLGKDRKTVVVVVVLELIVKCKYIWIALCSSLLLVHLASQLPRRTDAWYVICSVTLLCQFLPYAPVS